MSSSIIHVSSLEASENKSHHIRFACLRTFQHVGNIGAMSLQNLIQICGWWLDRLVDPKKISQELAGGQ